MTGYNIHKRFDCSSRMVWVGMAILVIPNTCDLNPYPTHRVPVHQMVGNSQTDVSTAWDDGYASGDQAFVAFAFSLTVSNLFGVPLSGPSRPSSLRVQPVIDIAPKQGPPSLNIAA